MEPHISSKFPRQQHSPTQCQRVWSHVSSAEIRVRIEIEFLVSLRASLRLYSTFNWKGLRALTKTWQKRRRSWPSETCWSCFTLLPVLLAVLAKFWDLTLTIWNEKGFLDPFIFRYKCIQMLAKHSLEFQAHQILMFQASVTFFSAFFGCQPAKTQETDASLPSNKPIAFSCKGPTAWVVQLCAVNGWDASSVLEYSEV